MIKEVKVFVLIAVFVIAGVAWADRDNDRQDDKQEYIVLVTPITSDPLDPALYFLCQTDWVPEEIVEGTFFAKLKEKSPEWVQKKLDEEEEDDVECVEPELCVPQDPECVGPVCDPEDLECVEPTVCDPEDLECVEPPICVPQDPECVEPVCAPEDLECVEPTVCKPDKSSKKNKSSKKDRD